MIRILCIRETPEHVNEGIDKHCRALYDLFTGDQDIELLPIENYSVIKRLRLLNKNVASISSLVRLIKQKKCDIVHIHGFASFVVVSAIIAAKIAGKKIVYTAHYHPIETLNNPKFGKFFFAVLLKPVLRFVNTFVSLNNEDRDFFDKYVKNVYQIPHWSRLLPINVDSSLKKKNMILFVGRNKPNKGVEHLMHLPFGKYEVHCVCGDTIIDRSDFILHHDITNTELSNLYKEASLLVVPSKYEAFSLVALEAFMHNTPVLMSDRVRIADYLTDCRGYKVFHYGDYEEFNNSIESAMKEVVDVSKIVEIFNPSRIKELYKTVYRDTVS
jgi:glycosyltransferase involved in cell wall biosynthesis